MTCHDERCAKPEIRATLKAGRTAWLGAALLAAAALTGCGGGGSQGASGSPTATAEGVYQGTTSTGLSFDALILGDGSVWSIYGNQFNGGLQVTGLFTGSGSSTSTTYLATTEDYPAPGSSAIAGTLDATYVAGSTLSGTITESGQTTSISGAVPVASTYDYLTPATSTAVSGTWSGNLLDGETATISVSSSGSLSGTSSRGCTFTGSITPRPGGKNVYNVTLSFGGSPCFAAGTSANGIALLYPVSGGLTQLIAAAVDTNGASATAFFAQR